MTSETRASLAYVRRLSHDVLQRSPSEREAKTVVGMPVARVVEHYLQRAEAMEQWVEEELFYYLLLDQFRPTGDGVTTLPARLRARQASAHDATAEIVLSSGFSLRNPGNDTFVTVVLEQCLGMKVQDRPNARTLEAGKKMYDGERVKFLDELGNSQSDVVRIVLRQRSFTAHLLGRHCRRLLARKLVDDDPAIDRVQATHLAFFDLLAEWLGSDEYVEKVEARRPRTDRQFIRSLYTDLLDRQPTYDELRNMRNALQSMADPMPLRAVMAKVVLDSNQAQFPSRDNDDDAFVRACFVKFLGRQPRQTELTEYLEALKEQDTTAKHVVRALLESPEYQFY